VTTKARSPRKKKRPWLIWGEIGGKSVISSDGPTRRIRGEKRETPRGPNGAVSLRIKRRTTAKKR